MARRKYAKEKKDSSIIREFNYIDEVQKLSGYSKDTVISILKAFELAFFEEVSDVSISSDELPQELTIKLPTLGELVISRLFEGRTDSLMYDFKPNLRFHESTKKAFYEGKTELDEIISNEIVDKYKRTYVNILGGGISTL